MSGLFHLIFITLLVGIRGNHMLYRGGSIPWRPIFSPSTHALAEISSNHSHQQTRFTISASKILNIQQRSKAVLTEPLSYLQTMAAGAISRSVAQTLLHPAYTYKTILQLKKADITTIKRTLTFGRLLRGMDAQFLMSLPHGAFHFYVIDRVCFLYTNAVQELNNVVFQSLI